MPKQKEKLIRACLFLAFLMAAPLLFGEEMKKKETLDQYFSRLADAIWVAEGGRKTKYPYGIKPKRDVFKAREKCLSIIRVEHAKWSGYSGRPFIYFLADRYAPYNEKSSRLDKLMNPHWPVNVIQIMSYDGRSPNPPG